MRRKRMLGFGQGGSYSKVITGEDIQAYASVVGDTNAIHLDDNSAREKGFKKRISHGMLTGSLISTVLGTIFPGEGTIYLEQDLKFRKPVYEGERCTATVSVDEALIPEKGIYKLQTYVTNEEGDIVITGYAVVKYMD